MSIKVAHLYNTLNNVYMNAEPPTAFHNYARMIVLDQKTLHIRLFILEPTEFFRLEITEDEFQISINGYAVCHGIGVWEPDMYKELLKLITLTLRQSGVHPLDFGNALGETMLTEMVKAGYIEKTVSWKFKV